MPPHEIVLLLSVSEMRVGDCNDCWGEGWEPGPCRLPTRVWLALEDVPLRSRNGHLHPIIIF